MVLQADSVAEQETIQSGSPKVLIVDDQLDVREALRLLLKGAGFVSDAVGSPEEALAAAAYGGYDLIVADMNFTWDTTSGEEGLRLVEALRGQHGDASIVVMTGWSTIELAVRAMQRGACDFIPKPWDNRRLIATLRKHWNERSAAAGRFGAELDSARKVQRKLLPPPLFRSRGLECECVSLPAGEVGGDLYDFFKIDSGATAFLLGDVSGKGIGAALLMANLQATIRGQRELAKSPARLAESVNGLFFESTQPEHFATLFYGVYEAVTRTLRYVNCGHPSAVLLRDRGGFELLDATATVLGAFPGRAFADRAVTVEPGDRLLLFSDGFSDSQIDALPEEKSDDWAMETVLSLGRSQSSGLAGVLASRAASGGKQLDDITVMDVRVL